MSSFTDAFRSWRRGLKARLPYVRRREHRVLQRIHAELIDAVDGQATPAAQARVHVAKALAPGMTGEVCLFVSFGDQPHLKPHAAAHIEHLLAAGIQVVLVVNTDLPPTGFEIDAGLLSRLGGVLVRENLGFDFGAWAHALSMCEGRERWSRLYLVNDSIVGPLMQPAFDRMIERIRQSPAEVIGLTESLAPHRHLQSYFLVFNAAALRSTAFQGLFARMMNWPTKTQVIELYEVRLTGLLQAQGLRCEAMFPSLSGDPLSSDDTSVRWAELVAAGFPYLKTRVIAKYPRDERIKSWLASAAATGSPRP
jgi:hypothetical protein